MKKFAPHLTASVLALAAFAAPGLASAADIVLSDGVGQATIDPSSSAGMKSWTINGIEQLAQQWFWYRIGSAGGEAAVNTISAPVLTDQSGNMVTITYSNVQLSVQITYTLQGSGVDMNEQILVTNNSCTYPLVSCTNPLDLHFFQYSNFDLANSANNDTVFFPDGTTASQTDPAGLLSETITSVNLLGTSVDHQAGFAAPLLGLLTDGAPTTLNNDSGPYLGDVGWAFEWSIALGSTPLLISKDKLFQEIPPYTNPEPASLGLIGAGLFAAGWISRRRSRRQS